MSKMSMENARHPEQVRRMEALKNAGLCYFCKQGSHAEKTIPISIHENKSWYVMKNDFPLKGSVHHYLIVPKRHVIYAHTLSPIEASGFFNMISWLRKNLKSSGYSVFARSGNMKLTGATLEHFHFHFLIGGERPKKATLNDVVPVVIAYKNKKQKK